MAAPNQKTIRIGVDGGDFIPGNGVKSGISRLLNSFMETASSGKSRFLYTYYCFGPGDRKIRAKGYGVSHLPSRLFSTLFLPVAMVRDRIRVYLGFSGVLSSLTRMFGIKSAVFIYDLGFYTNPQYYGDAQRMIWQTEYAVYAADRVIVCSDYIKKQLHRKFPAVAQDKIVRIYPGANHLPAPLEKAPMKERYFLYAGVIKPAKNIELLLSRFFDFLNTSPDKSVKLVLIGPCESGYFGKIKETALYIKLKDNLVFLDNVTDRLLSSYYHGCVAVLNVSHEEGFCFPVAEALQMGKRVIVNDIELYHEFLPHFTTLVIAKDGPSFLRAMNEAFRGKTAAVRVRKSVFDWKLFKTGLEKVVAQIYV